MFEFVLPETMTFFPFSTYFSKNNAMQTTITNFLNSFSDVKTEYALHSLYLHILSIPHDSYIRVCVHVWKLVLRFNVVWVKTHIFTTDV